MITKKLSNLIRNSYGQRVIIALIGVIVNVLLAFIMDRLGIHLFFYTIGTIAVSAIAGYFPGILCAVVTNVLCSLFNQDAIYFGFLNAVIAIITAWYARKYSIKKITNTLPLILILAAFSACFSITINWNLLDGAQIARNSETIVLFAQAMGITRFWSYSIYIILLNIIDKGIAIVAAWALIRFLPESLLEAIETGNWRQRPMTQEEITELNEWGKGVRHTMRLRSALTIIVTSLLLVMVTGWSGISLYFSREKESMTVDARNILTLVDELVDPEQLRTFITEGEDAPGYKETGALLQTVLDNYNSVENLCLVTFGKDRGRFIYDLKSTSINGERNRGYFDYDEQLIRNMSSFMAGDYVGPMEHGNAAGWMRAVTYPIKDKNGVLVCYAVAEISLTYMADYMKSFMVRSLLIFAGFFVLVLVNNLWFTNTYMVYPIRSMAQRVDDFSSLGYEQEQLDKNVKSIRALDIKTEDEVEILYDTICAMTLNLSEQMRDLRRLSEATAKMQDGLIITMADMVENRDSDTGEHIQKTALYVQIIVEGLKNKGYYAEKITPKFISDVVRSAPLHDIGKINIPDGILNKPGKLTEEEFEIMKTHTTAGKKIMENAISTVEGENYLKEARNMAAYHHERWDGKGYPEGLHGEVIPLSARIMAVADVFDALTSPRVYKPAFPLEKALGIITEEAGKQFDPKCVEVFMESLPEVKVILKKYNRQK